MRRTALFAAILLAGTAVTGRSQTRVFTGATLIDGTGREPVPNATIVVRDGRIVAAGPTIGMTIPVGAELVRLSGKYVVPGLINTHGHVSDSTKDLRDYAAYGVTTVVSLGGEPANVFAARAVQSTPRLSRSRVYVSGPVLNPRDVAEARAQVADVARQKVDFVKIRVDDNLGTAPKMTPDIYKAVISAAHDHGLRVATHLFYLDDAKALLAAGSDFIAHSVRDQEVDAAFVGAMKASGRCYTPTLMREVSTFVYESKPDFYSDPVFLRRADTALMRTQLEPARQAALQSNAAAQRYKTALQVANRNLKALSDAGVTISMGTDTGPVGRIQGYFELLELEMMTRAGLTPKQVLASATRDAARCMGLDRDLGTLEAGKWADFIVLDADPLASMANFRQLSSVWIAGNPVTR